MVDYTTPTGSPARLADVGYTDSTWDAPWNLARGQLTTAERMPSAVLDPGVAVSGWPRGPRLDLTELQVSDPLTERDVSLADLLRDRLRNEGFLVVHDGRVVAESYVNGLRHDDIHVVHSCSKTLTTMMVGIAVGEGRLDLSAPVDDLVAELAAIPAWQGVTLQHVLDMATGLDTEEHYEDADSMYWRYAQAAGYYGGDPDAAGVLGFAQTELTRRVVEPGTVFNYASYLTNLVPAALEGVYGIPAVELYEERIFRHLGAERPAIVNLDRFSRPVVEGQVNLTLRDFARWAWLYANDGRGLDGSPLVPSSWVDEAFRSDPRRRDAFGRSEYADLMPGAEYHNQAWLLDPRQGLLAMLGIHGQFAFVDPHRRPMMVGLSAFPDQANALMTRLLLTAWDAVCRAVRG